MKNSRTLLLVLALSVILAACRESAAVVTTMDPTHSVSGNQLAGPAKTIIPSPTLGPISEPDTVVPGGSITIGSLQEPVTLNPVLASITMDDILSAFFTEPLVQVDARGSYVPYLLKEMPALSESGLVVTYKLLEGVRFSNGQSFTCADMQYTLEVIKSGPSAASTSGYRDINTIDCPDEHTAVVSFAAVYAPYLRLFSYILPKDIEPLDGLEAWAYNRAPIGTGPWVVQEWVAGDHIILVKNPYFREPGKPYLGTVFIKFLPNRETGLMLLNTGGIDVLWDLTEADFPSLSTMQDVTYAGALWGSGENELLVFNLAHPKVDAPSNAADNPHPILYDVRVRQAIQFAINKQLIADMVLNGKVRVGTSVLPAGPFACPQPASDYSPARSKELLDAAGWMVGEDGIRIKGDVRMSMKITTIAGDTLHEQTAQAVVEMLRAVGIELIIDNVSSDLLFAPWHSNGFRKHGQFDILLYTTGAGTDPDSHMRSNYHSAHIPTSENGGAGNNFSRYANGVVDQWIDDAASTADTGTRQVLYCQVAAQLNEDLPRVFLYERLLISGYRERLQNFRVSPGYAAFTIDSQNWWIKP